MFRLNKVILLVAWAVSCFLFFEVAAHADETNEATKLTFSQSVQVPGRVLPAGTYLFRLADSGDRHLVQIINADRTEFYGMVMAIPTNRRDATDKTVVTVADQPDGPKALLKWFYPGSLTGEEFLYPKQQEQQLAREQHQDIMVNSAMESGD